MATYPGGIYSPRTKENKPGIVYDADNTTVPYAEDVTYLDAEVVAIQTELGTNPKGSHDSVKDRFDDAEASIAGKQDALGYTPVPNTRQVNGHALSADVTVSKSDVSLGNVDNTSDSTKNSATATLTNKRITKRIGTTASSSTPTPSADDHDDYHVTALAADATFGVPSGTPTDGQRLVIRIKDNGSARSLAWNAIYRAVGVTLPTTTVISKTLYVGMIYNDADSKWDVVATAQEA